ncbi:MAG: permease [Firmicutes bacterium]|jgi:uncharacterized membrane protein YraQ (UPF0718 family)|nr:permease [Bacillota bacterium]
MSPLARYRFPIAMAALAAAVALVMPAKAPLLVRNTVANFAEMLSVLPPIFVLLGLMDVWVPREAFVKYMGDGSGVVGALLAIIIGSLAGGPLYAAFPVASMMLRKGASFYNAMVLLGAWSTLKIPMFLFETASLGARFSISRWAANLPVILGMSWLMIRLLGPAERTAIVERQHGLDTQFAAHPEGRTRRSHAGYVGRRQ